MRHCLMLDLKDDAESISAYEAHHRAVWPEVLTQLREEGVLQMEIYRLGTRLCMLMETDDARFDPERMAQRAAADPRLQAWEALMDRFQQATPFSEAGRKWTPAALIFDLRASQPGP